jgi:membrane associated rhomboid family serine protease
MIPLWDGIPARRFPLGYLALPTLGASGAIAAVLGAYFVFYPSSRILTLVVVWLVRIPAWIFVGVWFLYQFVEANFGLISTRSTGGGVAFFAHVGGFLFGVLVARLVAGAATRQTMATAT